MKGLRTGLPALCAAFLSLVPGAHSVQAAPVNYQALFVVPNYPGGPTFDDNLALSGAAMQGAFNTWWNWAPGLGNISTLYGAGVNDANTTAALQNYEAGGARQMNDGDVFVLFYFGHGGFVADNEQAPAVNTADETLYFPNNSQLTDDQVTAEFNNFMPGVFKIFIDISCYSGGMWNGNDPGGVGDLETVPRTVLLSSSRENQVTYTGGLGPRPWEPLYLRNMIFWINAWPHNLGLSIFQLNALSAASGTGANFRFDSGSEDPTLDPNFWADAAEGDFSSEEEANFSLDELPGLAVAPEPGTLVMFGGVAVLGGLRLLRRKRGA